MPCFGNMQQTQGFSLPVRIERGCLYVESPPEIWFLLKGSTKLKKKNNSGGFFRSRYDARPVARAFAQMKDVFFPKTHASVLMFKFICKPFFDRTTVTSARNGRSHCLFYGKVIKKVYTVQPKSFAKQNLDATVCRLFGSLHGLKQARLQWNK